MEKATSIEPMKSEDIETLVRLNNLANDNAYRVARIFKKLNRSYEFIYSWEFSGKYVEGTGTETWSYGGFEDHYVEFPIIYLSLDDEGLEKIVDDTLKARKREVEKKQKKQKEQKEKKEQKEREEYERLKKKFEEQ